MAERKTPERKGGLGRGLAALIPTGPAAPAAPAAGGDTSVRTQEELPSDRRGADPEDRRSPAPSYGDDGPGAVEGAEYREIAVAAIHPNPQQPRTSFDEEALTELEHSIREFGLLQPVVVREVSTGSYQLVMGERRWRATQRAGLQTIPAIVRSTGDDVMLRDALLENIHRVQLNPLEEAAAYEQLLAEFGVTHTELADRLGRSRPVVTNTIRLLRLPVSVQRRVAAGVLSAGHARALLGLEDAGAQEELAARIVAEGMSVRATEEAVVLARHETPTAKPVRRRPMQAPGLQDLAERLSDTFDTRVKVELGQRKGRIVVEFGSVEDLERIATLMNPAARD
ncbi:ParB/RepB/Spo0J family partition protein [Pseudonocardia broussonetiae]|uniref:ParB/RepB/Spo0J family partition protein n=1 Tax=Pseudonocardia broussonetiae TaxID=2736640 RepID=A0A6M6JF81_9PSEU|nr:ParB/RepB/Spo0J family partition protein [Pseudonocardia broussonetiae]QJY45745.1 ParB/RepB/Spo0J family partition protein [Pseudonocardia broussonetiae]